MTTYLSAHALEQATFGITLSFTDEDGAALTPNSGLVWTLTDVSGNVINSREDESITAGSTITIVLSGDDLAIGTNGKERVVTVQGTYNSDLGTNLPLIQEVRFFIDDLLIVS